MILSFRDGESRAIYDDDRTRAARNRLPIELWKVAQRKLTQLNAVERLQDLAIPPSNHLKQLSGDRRGAHSIRINEQYRICFVWTERGPARVEVTDYH